ncbi:hypothetical protein KUM39_21610 [Streptomyces sp. J2-1]|nr:hypothetical protein [Streptomyces corallincola]
MYEPYGPPGADVPEPREVPSFPPVRVPGGRYRWPGARWRGRVVAAGLAVTAAALVAAGPDGGAAARPAHGAAPVRAPVPVAETVTAPVRIADAATVRLLRPGDRVDVIAAGDPASGGAARVLVRGVRVTRVPESAGGSGDAGALVMLAVPRSRAAGLVGAGASARLAVTLC